MCKCYLFYCYSPLPGLPCTICVFLIICHDNVVSMKLLFQFHLYCVCLYVCDWCALPDPVVPFLSWVCFYFVEWIDSALCLLCSLHRLALLVLTVIALCACVLSVLPCFIFKIFVHCPRSFGFTSASEIVDIMTAWWHVCFPRLAYVDWIEPVLCVIWALVFWQCFCHGKWLYYME